LILLTEQKPDNAKTVAERIRKSVAEQPFNTSVGKITVTISVGVTGANSQISSISMMIKTVDKALYKSKENGRNRVTMIDKI
jgi:diguanylate cyclase